MSLTILLAGATGVVGRRLAPLLAAGGHRVHGITRYETRAASLRSMGVEPIVADVFNKDNLTEIAVAIRPEIVIHQLTDLPPGLNPVQMAAAVGRNARIRDEGTRNLVAASVRAGARRIVAQSIAWAYAPGPEPHSESDPLDLEAKDLRAVTVRGVAALEGQVLGQAGLEGVVLRFGRLYGPGTGKETPDKLMPLHVDAAAAAAALAIENGGPGIFNIAESEEVVS